MLGGGVGGGFRTPKTILGFLGVLAGITAFAGVALIKILAATAALHIYIFCILVFLAAFVSLLALAVFVTAWINPEKLMLGEVQGDVYLKLLRLKQGDSARGEFIDVVPPPQQSAPSTKQLLSGPDTQTGKDGSNGS